jgi:hypothetical protein
MLSPLRPDSGIDEADLAGERAVLLVDLVERLLRVVDQIHLVDGQHHLADADQAGKVAVATRLRQHALARVDQDDGDVGGRRARDHVARVLLVAGGVGDDELAAVRREEAVRDVDRDALLALGRQAVDEQREVDVAALRAPLPGVVLDGRELVLEQHLRFVQQPPDDGGLAVVDGAAGDEAQQALFLVLLEVLLDVGRDEVGNVCHQKYPSCFFFSMDAAESWSIMRPCRSDVFVSSIS